MLPVSVAGRLARKDEMAIHPQAHRGGRGGAAVIRLNSSTGDDRIDALLQRPRHHEFQLAHLVPAESERDGVVALDEDRTRRVEGSSNRSRR